MQDKIKKIVQGLLDESFYEVPLSISNIVHLTKFFLSGSTGAEIKAVIDELIEDGILIRGIAKGYECGVMSAKKTAMKKPLTYLKPMLVKT